MAYTIQMPIIPNVQFNQNWRLCANNAIMMHTGARKNPIPMMLKGIFGGAARIANGVSDSVVVVPEPDITPGCPLEVTIPETLDDDFDRDVP